MIGITLLASVAALLPLSSAIKITAPAENSTVAAGGTLPLSWSTVDTDPSSFSFYLVNFVDWPPSLVGLAYNVDTTSGSASVQIPCNTNPSYGYQLNAINGTNTYVIYAQSPKFSISAAPSGCSDKGIPPNPDCSASASVSTITVTSTATICLSSTGLAGSNSSATGSGVATSPASGAGSSTATGAPTSATGSGPSSAASAPTTPAPAPTAVGSGSTVSPGTVPSTIGWGGPSYSNPVVVTLSPPASVASTITTTNTAGQTVTETVAVEPNGSTSTYGPGTSVVTGSPSTGGAAGGNSTGISPPISSFTGGAAANVRVGAGVGAGFLGVLAMLL
ncbi:MAG: hypothetical protein Q9227_005908 [Pyrenula ochraceoflavens]